MREVDSIERIIVQQIVAAAEAKYLQALQTANTNKLNHTIHNVSNHLFITYGDVTPGKLRELTTRVESLTIPPSEPVDTIWAQINNLSAKAEISKAPMAYTQKIYMAYIIFSRQRMYKSALCKWDKQLKDNKNWEIFKEHLCFTCKLLKHTSALTIKETLDHEDVMNLASIWLTNTFSNIQMEGNSTLPNTTTDCYETPELTASLIHITPDMSVLNSAIYTVSELSVKTLQQLYS